MSRVLGFGFAPGRPLLRTSKVDSIIWLHGGQSLSWQASKPFNLTRLLYNNSFFWISNFGKSHRLGSFPPFRRSPLLCLFEFTVRAVYFVPKLETLGHSAHACSLAPTKLQDRCSAFSALTAWSPEDAQSSHVVEQRPVLQKPKKTDGWMDGGVMPGFWRRITSK